MNYLYHIAVDISSLVWTQNLLIILDLQREYYFLTINDHGVVAPDLEKIHEFAFQERLILVGKHNGPNKAIENQSGQISFDDLREYAANFDVRTGKRKAGEDLGRNAKRRVNQTWECATYCGGNSNTFLVGRRKQSTEIFWNSSLTIENV